MRLLASLLLLPLLITGCDGGPAKPDSATVPESTPDEDADGDGFGGEDDCNEDDPAVNIGATEICNGIDDDCDTDTDEGTLLTVYDDADGDGYGDPATMQQICEPPAGTVSDNTDCDDSSTIRYPDRPESCDGIDNDCDGETDEDVQLLWYHDDDGDGYGTPGNPAQACDAPEGTVADNTDCDDGDPVRYPGNPEVCDGRDNDCNNQVDEGVLLTFYADSDADGWGGFLTAEACGAPAGYLPVSGDCDDGDPSAYPTATEWCDGVDNDCLGDTDEPDAADAPTWYADADADSWGDPLAPLVQCYQPAGYVGDDEDCDDAEPTTNPAQPEYCDGEDDNCDGVIDEDTAVDASTWYRDADYDNYGDARQSDIACAQPAGFVPDATDCNDANANARPGGSEVCDGIDNDCDGTADAGASDARTWYADADLDGSGAAGISQSACTQPAGYSLDSSDCDDANAAAYPGAPEHCDGFDNDCDGAIDEDAAIEAVIWYEDADGDCYGESASTRYACARPAGWSADRTDCDDANSGVHPGAAEYCDSLDNDCDLSADEGAVDAPTWAVDLDQDGYGNRTLNTVSCAQPAGYIADATDCDDLDDLSYPGAPERCDGEDGDCDGIDDTLGYWDFNEGSGAVAGDLGDLGLDGTITGATWTASGHAGGALDFDGSGDYVTMNYSELVPVTGLTLSAWVQPDSLSSALWSTVASVGSQGTGSLDCCRDTYFLGYFQQYLYFYTDGSINSSIHSSGTWSSHIGGWHHLLAAWSPTGARTLYIDGALVASDTAGPAALTSNGAALRVGADTNTGNPTLYFDGRIDEVKVFNCSVSGTQAYRDFSGGWPF